MTREQILAMNSDELDQRMAAIQEELRSADAAQITALTAEVDAIEERRNQLQAAATAAAELRTRVANGLVGSTVRPVASQNQEARNDASSPEYRRAFLLNLMHRDDEMTREERAAFVHTTANTAAVLPTTMLNEIWNLMEEQHSIIGDVRMIRSGTIIEIAVHSAIAAGDAKTVAENAANDDEQNTFTKITLKGNDFSKHIDVSYALDAMSLDAFETYITQELADRIASALASDIVTNAIVAKVATGNKVTSKAAGKLSYDECAAAFGLVKRAAGLTVYANRKFVYTYLVGMVDTTGRPIYQPNAQNGAEGVFIGAQVKIEDSVGDGVMLIGDPKRVAYNMVQDVMIETDRDIKKHVTTYAGYARGEGALVDPESFAVVTMKSA